MYFNVLEDTVTEEYGEDLWDDLLDEVGAEGAYTALGSYPDEEIVALIEAVAARLGLDVAEGWRWFGRRALPQLAERYPEYVQGHRDAKSFLLGVHDVIHLEVAKLYPDVTVPRIRVEQQSPETLVVHYESARRLCALAEGMLEASGPLFGQRVRVEQRACIERGDPGCVFVCEFRPEAT